MTVYFVYMRNRDRHQSVEYVSSIVAGALRWACDWQRRLTEGYHPGSWFAIIKYQVDSDESWITHEVQDGRVTRVYGDSGVSACR